MGIVAREVNRETSDKQEKMKCFTILLGVLLLSLTFVDVKAQEDVDDDNDGIPDDVDDDDDDDGVDDEEDDDTDVDDDDDDDDGVPDEEDDDDDDDGILDEDEDDDGDDEL